MENALISLKLIDYILLPLSGQQLCLFLSISPCKALSPVRQYFISTGSRHDEFSLFFIVL